jgi:dsDNA-specific endonuclease/ATPase MutS2
MDWLKHWPILVGFVGLVGWGYTIRADVDTIKENLGPPGSLPVIQYKIEQLGERVARIENILEKEQEDRDRIRDLIRAGQQKVDNLMDLMTRGRERSEETSPEAIENLERRVDDLLKPLKKSRQR